VLCKAFSHCYVNAIVTGYNAFNSKLGSKEMRNKLKVVGDLYKDDKPFVFLVLGTNITIYSMAVIMYSKW